MRPALSISLALFLAGCAAAPTEAPQGAARVAPPASVVNVVAPVVEADGPCAARVSWSAPLGIDGPYAVSVAFYSMAADATKVYVTAYAHEKNTTKIVAIDRATGSLAWTRSFEETQPGFGPLGAGAGVVVVETSEPGIAGKRGPTYVLDAATGETRWTRPAAIARGQFVGDVLVFDPRGHLEGVDPMSGAMLWNVSLSSASFSSRTSDGELLYQVEGSHPRAGALDAYRSTDGARVWHVDLVSSANFVHAPAPLVRLNDTLRLFEKADGAERWSAPVASGERDATLAPERIILASRDGGVRALDDASGAEAWRHDEIGPSTAYEGWESRVSTQAPATSLVGGGLLVLQVNGTYHPASVVLPPTSRAWMLDATSGDVRWDVDARDAESLAVATDDIILQSEDRLYAHRQADGALRWQCDLPREATDHRLVPVEQELYVMTPTQILKLRI